MWWKYNGREEIALFSATFAASLLRVKHDEKVTDGSDEPRIYLLPNLMTAGNLFCGFLAILTIFEGMQSETFLAATPYYERAMLLIFGSCLFDLLDGRLARLGGQESPFGLQFDSIADIVSFGLAPALLVSQAVLTDFSLPDRFEAIEQNVTWGVAFIYLLCGAMRLARFNCLAAMPTKSKSMDFRGIPIPMAAGFIASLTFLIIRLHKNDRALEPLWTYLLVIAMLGLSLLMMSNVTYPSFKALGWRTKANAFIVLLVTVIVVLTVKFYWVVPALLFTTYLLFGLCRPLLSKKMRRNIDEVLEIPEDPPKESPASSSGGAGD